MKAFDKIREINEVKRGMKADIENIDPEGKYSGNYRLQLIAAIKEGAQAKISVLSQEAENAVTEWESRIESRFSGFDYGTILPAVQLIRTAGKAMPQEVQEDLVNQYADNPKALKMLLEVGKQEGLIALCMGAEEQIKSKDFHSLALSLSDEIYYSSAGEDEMDPGKIDQFEKAVAAFGE